MTNRILPLFLGLLAGVLVVVFLWSEDAGDEVQGSEPEVVAPSSAADATPGAPSESDALAAAPAPSGALPEAAEASVAEVRREASTPYEEELDAGNWVEGRLVFPEGTPLDEEVWVVAKGKDFEHGPDHRARVAANGSFRVSFSPKTRTGRLDVEGRYLHLEEPVKVSPRKPEPVVLEPDLGGVLRATVIPPDDLPGGADAVAGTRVSVRGHRRSGGQWSSITRSTTVGEDLTFELTALPSLFEFWVSFSPDGLEPASASDIRVVAGEVREHVFELAVGVTVEGRVINEAGEPIAGQMVTAESDSYGRGRDERRDSTDEQGRFRIAGVPSGDITVLADRKGYEEASVELEDLPDRHVETGVELVLDRGAFIAGRVVWEDGRPADRAAIEATKSGESSWGGGMGGMFGEDVFRSEADGTFLVSGLEEGEYRIDARGTVTEEVEVVSELTGRTRMRKKKVVLRATADRVPVGTEDLELVLTRGRFVTGSVVDDQGAPVERFFLMAERKVEGNDWWSSDDEISELFKDTGGAFEMGLQPGVWELSVRAKGHANSEEYEIVVPFENDALSFVVPRNASIAGRVVTHLGVPVRGATVDVAKSSGRTYYGWSDQDDKTDSDGMFELTEVPPGSVTLIARAPGQAPSPEVLVEVAPGQALTGVDVALAVGATLTGEVRGADGRPVAHRDVELSNRDVRFSQSYQTDESGRFEATGLPAGTMRVNTYPSSAEIQALSGGDGSAASSASDLLEVREEVELIDGRASHVVLAPPDLAPVRVLGTILASGDPLDDVNVRANTSEDKDLPSVSTSTDSKGRFVLLVPAPGEYVFQLRSNEHDFHVRMDETIPARDSYRLELDLPVGSITGRVLDPDGEPLVGADVRAFERVEQGRSRVSASAESNSKGVYTFEVLPAGTYTLTCDGNSARPSSGGLVQVAAVHGSHGSHGSAQLDDIVLPANGNLSGIDLRLPAAGSVGGIVYRMDGSPAASANVTVARNDDEGSFSHAGSTAADGRFLVQGLGAGEYTVVASHETSVTHEPVSVSVAAGRTEEVQLNLAAGDVFLIRVVGPDGAPVEARPSAVGPDGVKVWSYKRWNENLWKLGPLRPGEYTLRASTGKKEASMKAEQTLEATGTGGETEVTLRLE